MKRHQSLTKFLSLCAMVGLFAGCSTPDTTRLIASHNGATLGKNLVVLERLNRGSLEKAKLVLEMSVDDEIITLHSLKTEGALDPMQIRILSRAIEYRRKHPFPVDEKTVNWEAPRARVDEILRQEK